ncbi:ROK family protein [Gleimia europaea]|uniref:ROK family protein n=1 Tax=Gleimia europaea TaxID=66228 RepID=UPI0018DBFA7D|nr:ROK family protein [Gleimia europaea]
MLDLIRSGEAKTRPELVRQTQLARNVITDRVERLQALGLVRDGDLQRSTGGRAPRSLELVPDAGLVYAAELGATRLDVGIANLSGEILASEEMPIDVKEGPVHTLETVFRALTNLSSGMEPRVWGMGIGLPGPVEWESGRPYAPPIMPGWDGFDVRGFFSDQVGCPVWVDNDVNMMAVGELRAGVAQGYEDVVYMKVGTGIGAGIVSGGKLQRGAQGAAGDIGHISVASGGTELCRCGNYGCLEAVAGGAKLIGALEDALNDPDASQLAQCCASNGHTVEAIVRAARFGDPIAIRLLVESARTVGDVLAQLVNLLNPAMIVVGGRVGRSLDLYLATLRQAVLRRSAPLATRSLDVVVSPLGERAGLVGAAFTAIDQLLSAEGIARLLQRQSLEEVV